MSLIMADLDLLRDINNTLRPPRRRRGAARASPRSSASSCATTTSRRASAARSSRSSCRRRRRSRRSRSPSGSAAPSPSASSRSRPSSEPIRATVSIGVAGFPRDGVDANELIHQADLAVYRAKLQGRNRVLDASTEPLLLAAERGAPSCAPCREDGGATVDAAARRAQQLEPTSSERRHPRPHALHGPRFFSLSRRLGVVVGVVSVVGIAAGIAGLVFGAQHRRARPARRRRARRRRPGARRSSSEDDGTISVSAVGALAGAALFGYRAALAARDHDRASSSGARAASRCTSVLFNVGALSLASLAAAGVFSFALRRRRSAQLVASALGVLARRRLLRRQHGPRSASRRRRGPREPVVGLPRALRLADAALPRLRLHRRRHRRSPTSRRPARARRLRGAAAPDAQDAGGVPQAHAAVGARSCARPPRRSRRRTCRSSRRTGCSRSARPRRWSPSRRRSTRATRTPPATRAASSSSRSRSAASSGSRRPSSTCSATRRSSTTSASSRSRTRSC